MSKKSFNKKCRFESMMKFLHPIRFFYNPFFLILLIFYISSCQFQPNIYQQSYPIIPVTNEGLIITEIGIDTNDFVWIEIYNPSSVSHNLSNYNLYCYSAYRLNTENVSLPSKKFILSNRVIDTGGFVILRASSNNDQSTGSSDEFFVNKLENDIISFPHTREDGTFFFQLESNNITYDFVQSGTFVKPTTGQFVDHAPLLSITSSDDYDRSVARREAFFDSDTAYDWSLVDVITPGIPNDVTNATDTDRDGIPDANEMPGSTFFGMPLYEWGARVDKRDIFVYVNYMNMNDKGVIPQKGALDKVAAAFSDKNIQIHFDVGDIFDQNPGTDPKDYDLSDDSHAVPHTSNIGGSGFGVVYNYEDDYMPIDKRQIFYYALFADTYGNIESFNRVLGIASIRGRHLIMSLGSFFTDESPSNFFINYQAATIMHELGHNFSLLHGGNEGQNYKPNYFSVMNYLYNFEGIPPVGKPGDRYYRQIHYNTNEINLFTLSNGPYSDSYRIDYSDGVGIELNESNLNETMGIGRGLGAIDWNTNGITTNSNFSFNINPDDNNTLTTLSDYDDWDNLYFIFYPNLWGNRLSSLSETNVSAFRASLLDRKDDSLWPTPCRFPIE